MCSCASGCTPTVVRTVLLFFTLAFAAPTAAQEYEPEPSFDGYSKIGRNIQPCAPGDICRSSICESMSSDANADWV